MDYNKFIQNILEWIKINKGITIIIIIITIIVLIVILVNSYEYIQKRKNFKKMVKNNKKKREKEKNAFENNYRLENRKININISQIKEDVQEYPYKRRKFLNEKEYIFYKKLEEIAEKYNCTVLGKITLASVVDVNVEDKTQYFKYLAKIQSKQIDFALAQKSNLYPLLIISVYDNSQKSENKKNSDEFIKKTLEAAKVPLLQVNDADQLEEKICKTLEW